jgi:hypothetical protein
MTQLPPDIEQAIADMTAEDFDMLVLRTRPPEEPAAPKQRAANALRRARSLDRTGRATKEQAAQALRQFRTAKD